MEVDFYSILNVTCNATEEEISKSYKKLVFKHHPDKNNANPEIIKQLNRAKEILLDAFVDLRRRSTQLTGLDYLRLC